MAARELKTVLEDDYGITIDSTSKDIANKQIKAKDSDGLQLTDDGGNGLTILDGGDIDVGYNLLMKDDKKIYFGSNQDASIEYDENGNDELVIDSSSTKLTGTLEIGGDQLVTGDVDFSANLTVNGALQLNNDMEATGNIDADGFTINGTPVAVSTDIYWNADGGDIYYRSGNVLGNPISLNECEITNNWEIPSGYNGMSVGPLNIDATITVNGVWRIL